jgi:phosphate transport system substrate-binding protein
MLRHLAALVIAACATVGVARGGELAILGTGDGVELLQALAEHYRAVDSSIAVKIPPSIGSGGGISAVGSGTARLARVARVLTDAERERGLIYSPVARLPSAIYVHPTAGITRLSASQLADIYAGRIINWRDVGGSDQRIRVVRREENDSTLVILRASMPGWKNLEITERSKTAVSTQEAVETVRLTDGAIGFGPYSGALEIGVKVVLIDGRHPTDARYPSSVELAYVYKLDNLTPETIKFMEFTKTPEAIKVIRSFGAIPAAP